MRVYIDHFVSQTDLAKTLAARIINQNPTVSVFSWYDYLSTHKQNYPESEEGTYRVLEFINGSDIIIPLITQHYLNLNSTYIDARLNKISDKQEKYIFPIICTQSNWSSINWIVRSKVFPTDSTPLDDLNEDEKERTISQLLQTIQDIVYTSVQQKEEIKAVKQVEKIIFISHDHDDADFAEVLKLRLKEHGITSWIDSERLRIGQDWREEIDEGISKSIAVIVVMSPEAKKSEYVTYEWAFAWGRKKDIFPIMLKQTALHPRLESLQYLDFTHRATRPWDRLITSIKELIE
jgi:TIR domain